MQSLPAEAFLPPSEAAALLVGLQIAVQVPFFMAQWEEHHVHTMRTAVGAFGVTEAQYAHATLMLATALSGGSLSHTSILS